MTERVGLIVVETTPSLGSIGRSAPESMTILTGFGYDSFEDACLAAELGLKGGCDALGEMYCSLVVIA